ncbi:MAG: translation initiation factor IF-2 subunit gamma [Candidatus Woesearchaeota archaeon]|jgi:translation initiation factor 2 subunit 3|nr:translation initiation factor IF-2 subunit gamma [Candidatus Woesearchaeota archaeon]|tara:strand:+ start:2796 stop:4064 length:1269 start_codon:yes stop_codon:yes gene_type:complete
MVRKKKDESQKEFPEQPVINIGMVGHVDHGKTTLLERLSGRWTDTHSEELKRGITIRLGYADVYFRKCEKCKGHKAYTTKEKCPTCDSKTIPLRKVSFVDAPGHESLMATMLSGATIMDGALLLVAANEDCPQPQTREHLMALEIVGIENVIVVQNKIDTVSEEQALKNYEQIKHFLKGSKYEEAAIIPISAQHRVGLNLLMQAIDEYIPTPVRDPNKDPLMPVARSFDINKPGIKPDKLIGGILGGSLKQGVLKVGDTIEIRPGRNVVEKNQQVWKPLTTKVISVNAGGANLESIGPGGSVGVLTSLDPSVVKSDQLTGSMTGMSGKLPKVWNELVLDVHLLKRVVGTQQELNVDPIKLSEALMLNVNSAATVGIVNELRKNKIKCRLKLPVCADAGSRVTISRRIGNRFRLIGYGEIVEK